MNNIRKVSTYKLINLFIILFLLSLILGINYYFSKGYCIESCSYEFKVGFIDPFFEAKNLLLTIFGFFLILPSHYFRRWIWYIASWAFPVLLYFISAESVYTSSIQSGPDFIAGIGMVILTAISALFVVGVFGYLQLLKYWRK